MVGALEQRRETMGYADNWSDLDDIASEDRIDSRDLVEYLERRGEELVAELEEEQTAHYDDDGELIVVEMTCGTCGLTWNDAATSGRTPVPSARCPFEGEDVHDLAVLREETEGYSGDTWDDGVFFIARDEFENYAKELAEDIGAVDANADWPVRHVDWAAAAEELEQDYAECTIAGREFLYQ